MPAEDEIIARARSQLPRLINETIARPEHTFREIVTGVAADLRTMPIGANRPHNIARFLADNPQELAALEQRLGNRPFGFQNIGDRALVLTFNDEKGQRQILRLTRHAEAPIPNSQSFHAGQTTAFNGTHISVTQPAVTLDTLVEKGVIKPAEVDKINARMKVEVARDGLVYNDVHGGNTAIAANGRAVVIDPGAVATEAAERARLPQHFKDQPSLAKSFLAKIDADKKLAATLTPLNAGIAPATESNALLKAFATPPAPKVPAAATRAAKGGIIPVITGLAVAGYTLTQGDSAANAAVAGGKTIAEGIVPGITDGFQDIRNPKASAVQTALEIGHTVSAATAFAGTVTGQPEVAIPATIANVAVNLAQDVAFVTGLSDKKGLVGNIKEAVDDRNRNVALFEAVDKALTAGHSTADTEGLNNLRSNRELVRQQAQQIQRYNPNALRKPGDPPVGHMPPIRTADGRLITTYSGAVVEMSRQFREAHHQYFDAVMDTAKKNPEAIAGVIAPDAKEAPAKKDASVPVAQAPSADEINKQFADNLKKTTYPDLSTVAALPARVDTAPKDNKEPVDPKLAAAAPKVAQAANA